MVLNTISVSAAVAPVVIETYFSHYLNRKPLRQKPTAHISYHEGLLLIRQFLHYASYHTVEEVQAFTSQWVPNPRWVRVEETTIPQRYIGQSADTLIAQLGHKGVNQVGGEKWWQWRREGSVLKAEWIEMRAHYAKRKRDGEKCKRVMLYVHGGAYFLGSVDEHRYQLQRHARKLEARVFAPRYRLAPQFPFPCGLHDCLSAYLYLLTEQDPSTILLAGDSAGGGMIVSMLVTLRDRGLPLPAGVILISPWVDLTHSFPSLAGDGRYDYIPAHGFMQRPSPAWPPPNADDIENIALHAIEKVVGDGMPRKSSQHERHKAQQDAIRGFSEEHDPKHLNPVKNANNPAGSKGAGERPGNTIPGPGHDLSIMIDGKLVHIKDQIQMYATNQLISHPLVSPVLSPSLGGLPPLLVLTGGGELLRDEQIYLAHKAANPSRYPPSETYLDEHAEARELITKYKPTDVQLQVWDDLCHVAPTLSFTRPAKYMFRSIAQFGAWALARAQRVDIEIMDDNEVSMISSGSDTDSSTTTEPAGTDHNLKNSISSSKGTVATGSVGKAGAPLPSFRNHMIRQRVDRHGNIFPLDHPSAIPALNISPSEIGVIKPGPVKKWLAAKKEWDGRFAREKRRVQKQRTKEMANGYQGFGEDEVPPPSALAGRRGVKMEKEAAKKRSWGMSLWSMWGSKHDESTMEREEKAEKEVETTTATPTVGATPDALKSPSGAHSRSRSRRRIVSDTGQSTSQDENDNDINENTPAAELLRRRRNEEQTSHHPLGAPDPTAEISGSPSATASAPPAQPTNGSNPPSPTHLLSTNRPAVSAGLKTFPFKLGQQLGDEGVNASTVTLESYRASTPRAEVDRQLGEEVGGEDSNSKVKAKPDNARPEMERFETAKEGL